jgi:two-component system CheB/CheR fusion protein
VVHELSSFPDDPGNPRFFELFAFLVRGQAERGEAADLTVVLVDDVTERETRIRELDTARTTAEQRVRQLQGLLDESTRSVRDLLSANEDLAIANSNLRSANEELLVGNEEAQAAVEEIETLNEEQQATNEELETLNEELQATVEELNATNEDLQARSLELLEQASAQQELMGNLRVERERLDAVLDGMSDAVMMVSSSGEPILVNAAFRAIFGDALPPLVDASGQRLAQRAHPVRMAARGEQFVQRFGLDNTDGHRRFFEARGQPVRADGVSGGVIVIRDLQDVSPERAR